MRPLPAAALLLLLLVPAHRARAQAENVPVGNQVYEFLDRMGVKGVLPLYSNAVLPLSRSQVAGLLETAGGRRDELSETERAYLAKFEREFARELGLDDDPFVLFGAHGSSGALVEGAGSDREKFLYYYADSAAVFAAEFVGGLEYRAAFGDAYGTTNTWLGTIGGRLRGSLFERLGFYLQATNGQVWGDQEFALADPRLAANYKLNEGKSANFDFTEAYLRLDWKHVWLQFGREYAGVGLGASDRLLLSENGAAFDFLKLGASYAWFRFVFLYGSILPASAPAAGIPDEAPADANKYVALHRFQFALFGLANLAVTEMVIHQRASPEFAYLNPVNFFKSAEHQLRDRDNALLAFDLEVYPAAGWKMYGTWLIDDIDFSKMGTGWWGNQFGWQAGVAAADVAGAEDLDAVLEWTRLEPYLYTNRLLDNEYSHNDLSLGHRLRPNSDEVMLELRYRASERLRLRLRWASERHGANVIDADTLLRNVGGDVLQGHRDTDAETAVFLDGVRQDAWSLRARADWEPVTNIFLAGAVELRRSTVTPPGGTEQRGDDLFAQLQLRLEY
jgi:hypothetical protein